MGGNRWGIEEPLPEEYSRVTNPGRFLALHRVAMESLARLQLQFDVERVEGYGLDQELEGVALARPTVKLIPADSAAASIVVAFTEFPSLMMRCGRWLMQGFPLCGCDACAETAEGEEQRLTEVVEHVVGGRFREAVRIPFLGHSEQRWELGSPTRGMAGGVRISRSRARALVGDGSRCFEWAPWPLR